MKLNQLMFSSSAAIYGARGANGVVLITTKGVKLARLFFHLTFLRGK
jgi:hypothetical protein